MKFSDIKLPSNKKFGFFFTMVFLVAAIYFWYENNKILNYIFLSCTGIFFLLTLIKAEWLLPLNKLWMNFGLLLGIIISPIVLGLIYFTLITPYSLVMNLYGRDELRLKFIKRTSYWKSRDLDMPQTDFKRQF